MFDWLFNFAWYCIKNEIHVKIPMYTNGMQTSLTFFQYSLIDSVSFECKA